MTRKIMFRNISSFLGLMLFEILPLLSPYFAMTKANIVALADKHHKESRILIKPSTLEIHWYHNYRRLAINEACLQVDKQRQHATNVQQAASKASWTLQPSKINVTATFDGYLELGFTYPRSAPKISIDKPIELMWFKLAHNPSETLVIPFSEGMRIPTNDSDWIDYLIDEYSGSNTCNDLKMPFWTIEQNRSFVNYLMTTATNNQLNFTRHNKKRQKKLGMYATQSFTTLNCDQPFVVRIALGSDILSGAKMYRNWHLAHHQVKTLEQRLNQNPELKKLIGASHVYLFGRDELARDDVQDWGGLKEWYFNNSQPTPTEEAVKLRKTPKVHERPLQDHDKKPLLDSIYQFLKTRFPVPYPTMFNNQIQVQKDNAQKRKQYLIKHTRYYLINPHRWGQAISEGMIQNLKKAGINKLWMGLDNWMPAFFQREVIEQAKEAGFLVGTYDSYNTAIVPSTNDVWLTAHLPETMRNNCAIVKSNGDTQTGFRGEGVYLNPSCHQEYVKQRIQDILKIGGFNSLFLDVDGTAMAREDYRKSKLFPRGMNKEQMLKAFNKRLDWIGNQQNVLLGTEDGNSLTTEGVTFAHGMETVGFGWNDSDMYNNKSSPYFLGAWYPPNKPAFFFAKSKVKPVYKRLLFSPKFRVPLYQTVFHDIVINSHHWHTDSIKFSNVQMERDLISMLYNTPAMVHLVRDEADTARAPRLQALKHYQDGFQPIHCVIWNQKLTDFSWLDSTGQIQQTTFSDGSKIIANFGKEPYKAEELDVEPKSILAKLSSDEVVKWHSKAWV